MKVRSKICGIKRPADLDEIASLGPDYMGFILYPRSERYMRQTLTPEHLAAIPGTIQKTGVFVNEALHVVRDLVIEYGFDAVQLHGDEQPAYIDDLKGQLPDEITIIKAFGIDDTFDWESLNDYQDCCDLFLFDTKTANYGGSGKRFAPALLAYYKLNKPVMLSGGIGIEDLLEMMAIKGLDLYGIDLNSRLEKAPGIKDINLVKGALKIIRHYERRG